MTTTPPTPEETLIEFPCDFPIKVMGETHDTFVHEVVKAIQSHLPKFDIEYIESRISSNGKYTSLTCMVYVVSKPQLDAIYRTLTAHPLVKVVL
ncbi:MAG: DUF493 domain-containing protein [Methylophilus sp.]|jgi:hypothetical protein